MSQHDMNLANAAGATFRADANAALAALASTHSGASAPTTTFAYMLWADTTTGLLKIRNAADSGWVTVGTLASAYLGAAQESEVSKIGKQTIWIPAGALTARTTNGAASGTAESTTNKVMLKTLDFDAATAEYAQFSVRMPKSWNRGAVSAYFLWSNASGTGNVVWGAQGVAISDDDVLDAAFGTAQTVTDAVTAAGDLMQSAETAAITIAGTPAVADWVVFQFYRDAASGSDTLAVDARLHGVAVIYSTEAANDA